MDHAQFDGMPELDERVAHVETSMEDQKQLNAELRADFRDLRSEIRGLRSTMERGFERLDQKIDKHFMWLIGIMLTGFATMFSVLIRVLDRLP